MVKSTVKRLTRYSATRINSVLKGISFCDSSVVSLGYTLGGRRTRLIPFVSVLDYRFMILVLYNNKTSSRDSVFFLVLLKMLSWTNFYSLNKVGIFYKYLKFTYRNLFR